MFRSIAVVLSVGSLIACTANSVTPPSDEFTDVADLDVYLEQIADRCAFTVGLRNQSNVRKGATYLELRWLDAVGTGLAESSVRLDPVRIDRFDAKNGSLEALSCEDIAAVRVLAAQWSGWNKGLYSQAPRRRIDNLSGQTLVFRWNPELPAYEASLRSLEDTD